MRLSFTLNLNLTLIKKTPMVCWTLFLKKMFFSKCWPRKIAEFCGFKANFCACFDPRYIPNMHQIALQSIHVSKIFRKNMPPDHPSKLRASPLISSLMEKLIFTETSHKNCWIDPWSVPALKEYSWAWENCVQPPVMGITKKRQPLVSNYSLDNSLLEEVKEFKDLGLTTTDNFNWNLHTDIIASKTER